MCEARLRQSNPFWVQRFPRGSERDAGTHFELCPSSSVSTQAVQLKHWSEPRPARSRPFSVSAFRTSGCRMFCLLLSLLFVDGLCWSDLGMLFFVFPAFVVCSRRSSKLVRPTMKDGPSITFWSQVGLLWWCCFDRKYTVGKPLL